jgi:hypothetical protein
MKFLPLLLRKLSLSALCISSWANYLEGIVRSSRCSSEILPADQGIKDKIHDSHNSIGDSE